LAVYSITTTMSQKNGTIIPSLLCWQCEFVRALY